MTLVISQEQGSETEELLSSFHGSIRDLRTVIEDLQKQVQTGQEGDVSTVSKLLSPADTLIRNCRKLEMILAEDTDRTLGIARGRYAIDLDHARFEVGCRLARLRTACGTGAVSD